MFDEALEYVGKGLTTVATFGGCCWAGDRILNKEGKRPTTVTTHNTTTPNTTVNEGSHRAPHRVLVRKDGVLIDSWGLCVDPAGRVLDPSEAVYTAEDLWEWRSRGWINSDCQSQHFGVEIGNHRFGVTIPHRRRQPQPQQYYEDEYYEDEYEYERPRRQPRKRRAPQGARRIRTVDGPDGPVRVYDYDYDED